MLHPAPEEASRLVHEWDVAEEDPEMCTPNSIANPARTSRALWTAMMLEGTALDYITGNSGLTARLRQARQQPSSITNNIATESTPFSSTTRLGGEGAVVDLSLIPAPTKRLIPQLCMDATFPPTYLCHGLQDTSVLPDESIRTYDQLRELGVPVELSLVEGEGHGFDWGREDEPHIKPELDRISEFLVKYLT